jgi:hypothetical protein
MGGMSPSAPAQIIEPFLAAAASAASTRPDVDADLAREVMTDAAIMLHNSLALDHLDEHDLAVAADALALDLTSVDPGAAVRSRAAAADGEPGLHDSEGVRGAYLVAVQVLGL